MQRYAGRSLWDICDMTSLALTPDCGPSHHPGDFGSCWSLGCGDGQMDGEEGRQKL